MGVPTSEVGYTSDTAGRGDHEVHKGYVVGGNNRRNISFDYWLSLCCVLQSHYFDYDDDDLRTDTGLAAGTPALLDHVLSHPMTCSLQ
jgi:hypothetical protein